MKLNLGCGSPNAALPALNTGWVWMDLHGWPVHVVGNGLHLPFRDESLEAVHCAHVIEHVTRDEALAFVREVRRVLIYNGYCYVSTPDADRTRAIRSHYWKALTKWGGLVPGWTHQWQPTVRTLRALLVEGGLAPSWATAIPTGHPPNTHSWPVDLEARFVCRRDDFRWGTHFPAGVGHL